MVYYRWFDAVQDVRKLVVPSSLKESIISSLHDDPLCDHLGQNNTVRLVKEKYIWHGMTSDCNDYVSTCAACNVKKKPQQRPKAAFRSFHAGSHMECVHVDILGLFKTSVHGNSYVVMLIDQFTKWIECLPIPNRSAETVARMLVDDFIARMGCPLKIHTDQGRQFEGSLCQAVCEILQISKTRTMPYHPCSNGQVERYNRQLLQMIRCFLMDGQDTNETSGTNFFPSLGERYAQL